MSFVRIILLEGLGSSWNYEGVLYMVELGDFKLVEESCYVWMNIFARRFSILEIKISTKTDCTKYTSRLRFIYVFT